MVSPNKAIEAAQALSLFCKERQMNCYDCPFGSDCLFKTCPSSWKLDRIKRIGIKEKT